MKKRSLLFLAGSLLFSGIVPTTLSSCAVKEVDYVSQVKLDLAKSNWENTDFL